MQYLNAALAGIAGTGLMTAFLYILSFISGKRLNVVKILGTMITGQTTSEKGLSDSKKAIVMGWLLHYAIGIGFALSFVFLWHNNMGKPDLKNGLILGLIYGAIAATVWRMFFRVHPNPPLIPLRSFLISIFIGHILFAGTVVLVFRELKKAFL
ncbi:MAG TPA: DUF6789 family protein [Cytophagales bacterium]|nr:DUF6789 family protein [Cytophagales bacterium]